MSLDPHTCSNSSLCNTAKMAIAARDVPRYQAILLLALRMMRSNCLPTRSRGWSFPFPLFVLFFVKFICRPMADPADASAQAPPVVPIALGTTFAVADFEGDGHPDLATNDGSGSFSEVSPSTFQMHLSILAPSGPRILHRRPVQLTLACGGTPPRCIANLDRRCMRP
jgi:hypothetical protein